MRKLICTFPLLVVAIITLAARADSFTYEFVRTGSILGASSFSTYLFTEPSILTVDTVIPIADITTNDSELSAFEINPVSPGAVLWTDSGPFESSGVANFTGALTSTGTFLGIGADPTFPFPRLTIAASPVPVPEPFSLMLLGTGTFGLLITTGKRYRATHSGPGSALTLTTRNRNITLDRVSGDISVTNCKRHASAFTGAESASGQVSEN